MDPSFNTPNENPLLLVMACRRHCDMMSRLVTVPFSPIPMVVFGISPERPVVGKSEALDLGCLSFEPYLEDTTICSWSFVILS